MYIKQRKVQSMSDVIIYVDQGFPFKNYDVSCLISIFDLSNPKMKIQHAKNQLIQCCKF